MPSVDDKVEAQIAKRTPAAHGLAFLPFVAGERSTGYHENAAGAVIGITTTTDAIDIATAALESVAYRFAEIFDQLRSVCRVSDVIASGGALRESPVWTRMIADVLGRNMSLPDTREASSRGAVLLALEAIGAVKRLGELSPPRGQRFAFSRARHSIYKQARMRHEELYRRIIED
jgi:gluconokinase